MHTHIQEMLRQPRVNKTHLQIHIYYIIPSLLKNERSCGLRCLSYIAVRISALLQIFWLLPLSLHHVFDVVVWFIAVFCSLFCDIRINYSVLNMSVLLFLEFLRNLHRVLISLRLTPNKISSIFLLTPQSRTTSQQ